MQPSQHCLYDVMDGSSRDLNLRPREYENTHEMHRVGRLNHSAIAPYIGGIFTNGREVSCVFETLNVKLICQKGKERVGSTNCIIM